MVCPVFDVYGYLCRDPLLEKIIIHPVDCRNIAVQCQYDVIVINLCGIECRDFRN